MKKRETKSDRALVRAHTLDVSPLVVDLLVAHLDHLSDVRYDVRVTLLRLVDESW